jgi:hypothetical protein
MAEMIVPGTYIDVRSEGLISAGRIATGIVGVVGTAASGPIGTPVTLSGFAAARDTFGAADDFRQPQDGAHPLTLVRALQQIYANGASTVIAVRVAGAGAAAADLALKAANGDTVATIAAATPGTWGADLQVSVDAAADDLRLRGEVQTQGFARLAYAPVLASAENQIRVQRGASRTLRTLNIVSTRIVKRESVAPNAQSKYLLAAASPSTLVAAVASVNAVRVLERSSGAVVRSYQDPNILVGAGAPPALGELRIVPDTGELVFEATQVPTAAQRVEADYAVGHAPPTAGQVLLTLWDGSLTFAAGEAPVQADGDALLANYVVDRARCVQVTLGWRSAVERYTVPDGKLLASLINASSRLARATAHATNGGLTPKTGVADYLGTGSNTAGNDGADASPDDHALALEPLANMLVNIVHLAGQDSASAADVLQAHLNATAQSDFERIGVIGAAGHTVAQFKGHSLASDRVVLVAPGLKLADGTVLPAPYAAAAVTGLISSLPPHTSLTNKAVAVAGLELLVNRGEQEQLIKANVLTLALREGLRVVKGISTAGEGAAFSSIPIRRIVDYAKYGVRSAANSYLGRLNNTRVRGALKATLDGFLTRMVDDEMLTGYELEVSATRAQEIAGEVTVAMTIQPTFSIDYIRVVMVLK